MREIPLTQGKVALVDDEDYERTLLYTWYAAKNTRGHTWYAQTVFGPKGARKTLQLHRFLMDAPEDAEIDHRDGDGLNCRRYNMRICTATDNRRNRGKNQTNTSGFKGVAFQAGKWRARLSIGSRGKNKRLSLGMFETAEEAARAYDVAALKHHGEFARLNFSEAA